jgi:hypothetical protein
LSDSRVASGSVKMTLARNLGTKGSLAGVEMRDCSFSMAY